MQRRCAYTDLDAQSDVVGRIVVGTTVVELGGGDLKVTYHAGM